MAQPFPGGKANSRLKKSLFGKVPVGWRQHPRPPGTAPPAWPETPNSASAPGSARSHPSSEREPWMAQGAALCPPRPVLAPMAVFPGVLTGRDGEGGHGGLRGTPALHVVGRHSDVVRRALQGEQHTQRGPASPGLAGEARRIPPSPPLQDTKRSTQPHPTAHWLSPPLLYQALVMRH